MEAVEPYQGALNLPAAMRHSEITIPGVELHHFITDDQLTELSNMRAEPIMELFLASVGLFFGSLIPTIEELSRFNSPTDPMGIVGLVTALITFGSLVAAGISGCLWKSRYKKHGELAKVIRSRAKVAVKIVDDTNDPSEAA